MKLTEAAQRSLQERFPGRPVEHVSTVDGELLFAVDFGNGDHRLIEVVVPGIFWVVTDGPLPET